MFQVTINTIDQLNIDPNLVLVKMQVTELMGELLTFLNTHFVTFSFFFYTIVSIHGSDDKCVISFTLLHSKVSDIK